MPHLRHWLIEKSRDRDFLLRVALLIGALGIAAGFAAARLRPTGADLDALFEKVRTYCPWYTTSPESHDLSEHDALTLQRLLDIPQGDTFTPGDLAEAVRQNVFGAAAALDLPNQVLADKAQLLLFRKYGHALHRGGLVRDTAETALKNAATTGSAPRFAHAFYADVRWRDSDLETALDHFRKEIAEHPEATFARSGVMEVLLQLERTDELRTLFADPAYRGALRGDLEVRVAVALRRWGIAVLGHEMRRFAGSTPAWLLVAAFSAVVWFSIIITLGGIERLASTRFALYALGLVAGIFSTWVVLGVVIWQQDVLGFDFNGELGNDLIVCISGIGLREELVKLLFFVPFLPVLLKRKSSMEALAVAACVGLGFATWENLGYFGTGRESAVFGRFITANFFHAALSGVLGLSLFHLARWPKTRWEEFLGTFIVVVLAHGLYDALLGLVPGLAEQFSYFSFVIFAACAVYYLKQAREIRGQHVWMDAKSNRSATGDRRYRAAMISPLGTFVIGSALLLAASWVLACWNYPLDLAMQSVGGSALGLGVVVFLFINHFRSE